MTEFAPLFIGIAGAETTIEAETAGSKAAQLWQISRLGLAVPPAFVMPTALCRAVNAGDEAALAALRCGLQTGMERLGRAAGRQFGDDRAPLLVSVRSGAARSMPGMLDTILNVGLNRSTVRGLIRLTGNPRLAWDSFRRFIQNYAKVVHGIHARPFETRLADMIHAEGCDSETSLDPEALECLTYDYLAIAAEAAGQPVPEDPAEQLEAAARAVYGSWNSSHAAEYRRLNNLEALEGTAVTVQAMVFGNAGGQSGAGVAFSRNPATGDPGLYVDFLFDAQGEDVVSGRRSPRNAAALAERLPQVAKQLADGAARLEAEARDLQDVEFTVQEGRLFFLQTRPGKRTPRASLRLLVDFVREGLIDRRTALARAAEIDLDKAGIARFVARGPAVASAIPASAGVASGRIAFDSQRARAMGADGMPVILVRPDTATEDVAGFAVAAGILTAVGGRTAHAAVVARQLGKVCLVGCRDLLITDGDASARLAGHQLAEGDWISLDGETGEIMLGRLEIAIERPEAELAELAAWRAALDAGDERQSA